MAARLTQERTFTLISYCVPPSRLSPFHLNHHCFPSIYWIQMHLLPSPVQILQACVVVSLVMVYKQGQTLVSRHRSYSGLLFRCTPSYCPVSMWKSASQGHRVTFLQLFGILPQGSSSKEVCVYMCRSCLSSVIQNAFCQRGKNCQHSNMNKTQQSCIKTWCRRMWTSPLSASLVGLEGKLHFIWVTYSYPSGSICR